MILYVPSAQTSAAISCISLLVLIAGFSGLQFVVLVYSLGHSVGNLRRNLALVGKLLSASVSLFILFALTMRAFSPVHGRSKRARYEEPAHSLSETAPESWTTHIGSADDRERQLYQSSDDDDDAVGHAQDGADATTHHKDADEAEVFRAADVVRKPSTGFVPTHGNYRGYYTKRRFSQDPRQGDPRLALIPRDWIEGKRVLDVGCNEGKFVIEIAQNFGPWRVTGVDIDGELIRRANKNVRIAWSMQTPLPALTQTAKAARDRLRFGGRREASRSPSPVDAEDAVKPAAQHFPIALTKMFGYLPQVPHDRYLRQYVRPSEEQRLERSQRRDGRVSRGSVMPQEVHLFPSNLSFKKADWVNDEIGSDRRGYNVIFALSVSKWLHLNGGDSGIREFFTRVFIALLPSGRFIFEPQAWESYHKATRMSEELKASYAQLKLRPNDFERILLEEIGFKSVEQISTGTEKGFKRQLYVFHKSAGNWL